MLKTKPEQASKHDTNAINCCLSELSLLIDSIHKLSKQCAASSVFKESADDEMNREPDYT